jgi:acetylglutamate kinase
MRRSAVTRPTRAERRPRRTIRGRSTAPVVLKLGGELLEEPVRLRAIARAIARTARVCPLVVVHGGGREIDAALAQASIPKRQVDGLRITDEPTLHVVVAVLAGSINTRFVATVNAVGGRAVGLTSADAGVGLVEAAPPHRATNGELVNLGRVGEPVGTSDAPLIDLLCRQGFVPVVACVGAARDGQLFNVNADTLASSLATRVGASRLVVAGATAGVLDGVGRTIDVLDGPGIDGMVDAGSASAGMVAKLRACRRAAAHDVADVFIADGREPSRLGRLLTGRAGRRGPWTRIIAAASNH